MRSGLLAIHSHTSYSWSPTHAQAWLATQSVDKGLVDEIATSDEYIRSKMLTHDVIAVAIKKRGKKPLQEFLERGTVAISDAVASVVERWIPGTAGTPHGFAEARAQTPSSVLSHQYRI